MYMQYSGKGTLDLTEIVRNRLFVDSEYKQTFLGFPYKQVNKNDAYFCLT